MTFSTIDSAETNETTSTKVRGFLVTMLKKFNAYRIERKGIASVYHHHSEKTAILDDSQRELNRVMHGPSFF